MSLLLSLNGRRWTCSNEVRRLAVARNERFSRKYHHSHFGGDRACGVRSFDDMAQQAIY